MDRIIYTLSYNIAKQNWDNDTAPKQLLETAAREKTTQGIALDLGCGTGTQAVELAKQGWTVYGIDYVSKAIKIAQNRAFNADLVSNTHFIMADVAKLSTLDIPQLDFSYDLGCLHALKPQKQSRYASGLAKLMRPGTAFLLFALKFRNEAGFKYGMSHELVEDLFKPYFILESCEENILWDKPGTWFWLRRKAG